MLIRMELSPGEVSQQEWLCIPSLVSRSGLGVCDSPQCPGSRVTRSWVRREPHCRGEWGEEVPEVGKLEGFTVVEIPGG